MASCLNSAEKGYRNFDVEQTGDDNVNTINQIPSAPKDAPRNRRCSIPLALSLLALALGCLGLIFGIYGAMVARKGNSSSSTSSVLLSSRASGSAGSLFQGTGYFARLQPMMYSRSDHKSIPVGDTVYLVGGLTNARLLSGNTPTAVAAAVPLPLVLNRTVAYNTYTQAYSGMADMPQPRFRHCGAVMSGRLFVIGGMSAWEAQDAPGHVVSDNVMVFDPATNAWTVLPGRLNHPRADCCAAAAGGKLYVAGGWTTDYADTLGSVEVFDAASGTWSLVKNLTLPRGDCEAVSIEDRYLLVLGGVAQDGSFTSSVEALDTSLPASDQTWSTRSNMTKARGDFAAEALPGDRVIVMGGETTNGTATEFAIHSVEEYVFSDDVWIPKAPLPEARFRFDTAHVGEMVYVFGGAPTCSSVLTGDGAKSACLQVALNTTWGYFDVRYPNIYYAVKQ